MTVFPSTPLWIAARTLLAEHAEEFFSEWKKTAETLEEDDVHDFRVASRRLREALALFSPTLPSKKRKKVAKQVKGITRMLGELRNTDEAFRFFSDFSDAERSGSAEEIDELLAALRREREEAHQHLKTEMGSLDPAPLQRKLESLEERPDLFQADAADPFVAFPVYAAKAIMERAEPVAGLLPQALQEENGGAQHQLRIALKKLRYRIEIMEPLLGAAYDELRSTLKGYQDVLGKLHDVDVFAGMVQERVPDGSGKEHLREVLAGRRKSLYRSFTKMLKKTPVGEVGQRAKDALQFPRTT